MKKTIFLILILAVVSILLSLPLLKPGLYTIHDDQQIARLFLFDKALKAGQFPPRWVDELGFGFGYPLFVFYPPLVYFLGEIFHLTGFGFIGSVKLVFFTSIFASGLAMYLLVKELWGRLPAHVSSLFYMAVPYRAIDIYVRGALAESFSFVWLPLILWSFYKLYKTNRFFYIFPSAVFLAFLMITHNLIFLPFMVILPFYLLFLIWHSRQKKILIINCMLSVIYSFALSAFFWLPSLLEKKFTIVDKLLLVNLANYKIHFVYPQQLWNWPWGFGGSTEGLFDGISFKIGKLHIIVSVAAFLLSIIHIVKSKFGSKILTIRYQLATTFFMLFILSAFMTTFYSKFIWDIISPLAYLQFPWRFLTFTALFGSVLSGTLIFFLRLPILKLIFSVILLILLFVPNLKLFKPQFYRPNLTDKIATSSELINWDVSQSSFEYIPNGVELYVSELGTNLLNISKDEIPKEKMEIVLGNGQINNLEILPHKTSFDLDAKSDVKIKLNIFNFPGWKVKVDSKNTKIDDQNKFKLITFNVESGFHHVVVKFVNTPIRSLANLISIFSIALLVLGLKKWRALKIL